MSNDKLRKKSDIEIIFGTEQKRKTNSKTSQQSIVSLTGIAPSFLNHI